MSKTYKVEYSKNNEIIKIYVFIGDKIISDGSEEEIDLYELFRKEPEHPVFENIFHEKELEIIRSKNIPIKFCKEIIHTDDTIDNVKKKIIKEFDSDIAFEEIYLFHKKMEQLNSISVYQSLTQNDKLDLTKEKLLQYLLNIDNISNQSLPDKDFYEYDDILSLNLDQTPSLVLNVMGHKFVGIESNYPFTVNPYDVSMYDPFLSKYSQDITSITDNNLLMNCGDINQNIIYLCLANDVLDYSISNNLSQEITLKIYFPKLYVERNIKSIDELRSIREELVGTSKKDIGGNFLKKIQNINMFYNIYDERMSELDYKSKGIKSISLVLHPTVKYNLPLDIVFKLIHATEEIPLIKFNPHKMRENIYRLYCDKTSTNGKKIPYLNKATIFRVIKQIGTVKSVAAYIEKPFNREIIPMSCTFSPNGDIVIDVTLKTTMDKSEIDNIIATTVNPIINTVKGFLEQSGYTIGLFNSSRR